MSSPRWLRSVQEVRLAHPFPRPAAIAWEPTPLFPHRDGAPSQYRSDPYTYLQYAREMRSFYAAHRREPLFPYMTRLALALLGGQDVAVSFTSAACSILAVGLTFAVGALAFSPWVGLAAAFFVAIEYDIVTTAAGGWRDDAFTAAVLLFVVALLGYARDSRARVAVLVGVAGGLACLVRITSLSFVVPGVLWMLAGAERPWRIRAKHVGVAALFTLAVLGPFLVNCWRAYGDPFYSINVHADVYRETEGAAVPASGVRDYIGGHLRQRPIATIDTAVLGVTRYPFANKWTGFDRWISGSGTLLAWAALAGLIGFAFSAAGRLLLLVLVTSLVPFALTWQLLSDWRFTEHAYPFFLIAAAVAIVMPIEWLIAWRRSRAWRAPESRLAALAVVLAVVTLAVYVMTRVMPAWVFAETLRAGEPATVLAGDRDRAFFDREWSSAGSGGRISLVTTRAPRPSVRLPLRAGQDYDALVRLDPRAAPVAPGMAVTPVQVLLNGHLIATCDTGSTPERIGVCRFQIPREAVKQGSNRLTFAAAVPEQSDGFRLWYVRLQRGTGASVGS